MNTTQIGVDLAKSVFEVAVSQRPGHVQERHRLSRTRVRRYFEHAEPATVLLEACGAAHHWGRELQALGHSVRLLHPGDVARYRDGNKTDRADAKALLEAARNTEIDPVPIKSVDQQAVVVLHRMRQSYLRTRTSRINSVRSHLREFGIPIPIGAKRVIPHAIAALETDTVPPFIHNVLREALTEIEQLQAKAQTIHDELARLARHMPNAALLMTVPGVGVLTATAMIAFIGDVRRFRNGRALASFLGLTPREHSSGSSRRLGRITKRGNSYVRMMLIHGARSALRAGKVVDVPDDLRTWALEIDQRKGHNVAAVALANKLARVCWRVWRDQRAFERRDVA